MAEGSHDGQHLTIPILVVQLCPVKFLGPILDWVQ